MTQVEKVVTILQTGPQSEAQLALRLRTSRNAVRSAISKARRSGTCIYLNPGKFGSKGRKLASTYRIGTPTREMIAVAYTFMGA